MSDKKDTSTPAAPNKSDTAVPAAPAADPALVAALRALVTEMMPVTAAVAATAAATASKPAPAPTRLHDDVNKYAKCPDCEQVLLTGCKGEHVKMVVWPREAPEFFRGHGINGVWYKSRNPGEAITVPANAAGDIGHAVNMWDLNERELQTGKKRFHNSGTLGQGGQLRQLSSDDFFR